MSGLFAHETEALVAELQKSENGFTASIQFNGLMDGNPSKLLVAWGPASAPVPDPAVSYWAAFGSR